MSMSETPMPSPIRLGVNIDHVATLRNARGAPYPDLMRAARLAVDAGANNITAHLREDRRHIKDADIAALVELPVPLNMEMAVTPEMLAKARSCRPHACCLVPERRQELTTEGGLNVIAQGPSLNAFVAALQDQGIRVSLFVDAEIRQIDAAKAAGADAIELHTGPYCEAELTGDSARFERELARLQQAARHAAAAGLEVHAGHGLTYSSVGPVAAIAEIVELNIGHFLVAEALYIGLAESVRHMRSVMSRARRAGAQAAACMPEQSA